MHVSSVAQNCEVYIVYEVYCLSALMHLYSELELTKTINNYKTPDQWANMIS